MFGVDLHVYEAEGNFSERQHPIEGGRIAIFAIDAAPANAAAKTVVDARGHKNAYKFEQH